MKTINNVLDRFLLSWKFMVWMIVLLFILFPVARKKFNGNLLEIWYSIRWDMLLLGLPLLGISLYALLKNKWKNKI